MDVVAFLRWSTLTFLAVLALTITCLMLTGRISTCRLLRDKQDGRISPGRIQALVATLYGSIGYLMAVDTRSLPPVPSELLAIVGGSHSLYLIGKLGSTLQRRSNPGLNRSIS